jgi:hypothetical protein
MALARVLTHPDLSQVEVEFPCAPDLSKGRPGGFQSVAGHMSLYEYVHGIIVSVFSLLSFSTHVWVYAAQEVCTERAG